MDYKSKYLKYKNKYLQLKKLIKYNQIGGFDTIISDNSDFLQDFTQVQQFGQMNCGIYISEDNTKIMKCSNSETCISEDKAIKLESIKTHYPTYKIFPDIYNCYLYNRKSYIIMEKFDGDITKLLFELLPINILEKMVSDGIISPEHMQKYYELFHLLFPKTSETGTFNYTQVDCIPIIKYLYSNKGEIPEVEKLADQNYNIYRTNGYRDVGLNQYKGMDIGKYGYYLGEQIKTIDFFSGYFADEIINYEKYMEFINEFVGQFNILFEQIKKQIFRIKILLAKIGLAYTDDKTDNYVYMLADSNHTHLGINWNSNIIFGDKYFFVSVIDWDSGLSNFDEYRKRNLISDFNNYNPTKYGQYYIHKICNKCPIIKGCETNIFDLNEEGFKILKTNYQIDKIMHNFTDIREIINYINEGNEQIDIIDIE